MTPIERYGFAIILLTYGVAGTLFVSLTPPWQSPDEPAHYNYVRYLATHTGFPELVAGCYNQTYLAQLTSNRFPPELPIDTICYEYHQPPLYYLLATPVFAASSGSLTAIRFLSILLGAGVVALAFFIARTIFPTAPAITLGAMAFVAFVPMHVSMLAAVNNDALAGLVLAATLLLLLRRLGASTATTHRYNISLGVLLGLGLLVKTTAYILAPAVAAGLLVENWPLRRDRWPNLLRSVVIIFGLALLIALPWYARNATLYGGLDILGLARHDEIVVGQLRTASYLAEVGPAGYVYNLARTTFHSFWGQFGWMAVPMDARTYRLLLALVALAGVGLLAFLTTQRAGLSARRQKSLGLLALVIGLNGLGFLWYNLTFVQFQGRYLFPAIIPLGLFFALGLNEAMQPRWRVWLVTALAGALGWLALASGRSDGLDKWGVLLAGLFLAVAAARLIWPRYETGLRLGLLLACYGALALLTLLSPVWFIQPFL